MTTWSFRNLSTKQPSSPNGNGDFTLQEKMVPPTRILSVMESSSWLQDFTFVRNRTYLPFSASAKNPADRSQELSKKLGEVTISTGHHLRTIPLRLHFNHMGRLPSQVSGGVSQLLGIVV